MLLAFVLASCGGSGTKHAPLDRQTVGERPPHAQSTTHGPPARIPPASAVPMTATPRAAFDRCRRSKLLRPICPQRVPLSLDAARYNLADGCANAPHVTIASSRCTLPAWSYETFARLPGPSAGTRISAWDGRAWFASSYATMIPPPYHVHVDIQASAGPPPPSVAGPSFAGAEAANRPADALLRPERGVAVSFGWVRWHGRYGQLTLAPTGPNGGGEEAGHLIFYFVAGGVNYDISLHAWASKIRIIGGGMHRVIIASPHGPALPHVIATLEAIVGSTISP